jgi:hypothetical protein
MKILYELSENDGTFLESARRNGREATDVGLLK